MSAGRKSTLDVDSGLALGHLPSDHRLRKVLVAALARVNIGRPEIGQPGEGPAFEASYFGLDRVDRFKGLDAERQDVVLRVASTKLMQEAYFIEKLGLAFGAKMLLLSHTTEERMMYALFAADEARHLHAVAAHIEGAEALVTDNAFHTLLSDVIEGGDKETLTFVIQVVLEGWGLTHYRALADGCRHGSLRGVLRGILEDEARHHGSGKVLVEERGLSGKSQQLATEVLADFLQMVRPGPLGVVSTLERVCGGLSSSERVTVLEQLEGPAHARGRLELLRKLMDTPSAQGVIRSLEDRDLFTPLAASDAAAAAGTLVREAQA